MSRLATIAKLASPVILAALTGCAATMQAVKQDAAALGGKIQSTFAPTPEQQAATAQREAAERAQAEAHAQAAQAAAANPNSYLAPSLNPKLALKIHSDIQTNKRFNPQGQPMAFDSRHCEAALKSGIPTASVPQTNPNNPNSIDQQIRGRVNGAINGRLGNSTLGQIFQPSVQGMQTAEAVRSKQIATTCGNLVEANKLANAGQLTSSYARVNNILNSGFSAGMIGVPGTKWSSETSRGITADGVQGTIGVIGGKIVDLLPSTGQGGAFGDLLNKVPGLRR